MSKDTRIIAAMDRNRVIGQRNKIPWGSQVRFDLNRFKILTSGHTVIMGRKTFESIERRLAGRRVVVLSRNPNWSVPKIIRVSSMDEALNTANSGPVFVAGGEEIYRQALLLASLVYLTVIDTEVNGDAFFPDLPESVWEEIGCEHHWADNSNAWDYRFLTYRRRTA